MSYLENLDPAPSDDNLFYLRRLQAGLSWNILKDGYLSHQYKAKAIQKEKELEAQANSKEKKQQDYMSRWHSIMFMFNQVKVDILNQRKHVVKTQLEYSQEFYRLKLLKKEDILSSEARMAEIKAMYTIYGAYNDQLAPDFPTVMTYADNIAVFDLNIPLLLNEFDDLAGDTISKISEDLLKYKTSLIHDIKLSTFFRYNWYDIVDNNSGNRSFFSLGVNASIPIPFNQKLKKEIAQKSFELKQYEADDNVKNKKKDLINAAYEYRYKLKQYINFYEKRIKYIELLRQENVLLKLDPLDFNPINALGLIDDILKIDIELVELNQNMYLKALSIYSQLPYVRSRELMKPFLMPDLDRKEANITRSFYLWSSGIKQYNSDFINEYLKYSEVDEMVVSINKDQSLDSSRKVLLSAFKENQFPVHLMIGRNKLMSEGNLPKYLSEVTKELGDTLFTGIHLDIEPHTFDDYKTNKLDYLNTYLKLVQSAKVWCDEKGKDLSVSVPLHYDKKVIDEIYNLCDKVYFMCYENVKFDYLNRKLNEFDATNKTVIALRSEDFETRLELEQLIDQLKEHTNITHFCLHDFTSVYALDANILKGKSK